jgi:hypothetical protein
MSQPPYHGGPPEEEHPSQSQGGTAPGRPEGGPSGQNPPQGPQQQPYPPGGAGSPYVSGAGPQGPGAPGPQYGGQGPTRPPPGGPGQGGYQQYPYGPPPPSGGGRRTGLIVGVIIAVAVLVVGVLALVGVNLLRDGDDQEAGGDATTEEATGGDEGETTGPPSASDAVGLCLPYEPVIAGAGFDLSTDCSSTAAFWTVTEGGSPSGATVDADGQLTDNQPALDLCGAEHGSFQLGELWKDFYFTYDSETSQVEQMLCVEAIGNPDASGRLPITPDTGSCFDDSDQWWTVPCDQPEALYTVVDTVTVDPPREMTLDEADEATAPCSGGAFFWQVLDVEGRTTDILCGDEL